MRSRGKRKNERKEFRKMGQTESKNIKKIKKKEKKLLKKTYNRNRFSLLFMILVP